MSPEMSSSDEEADDGFSIKLRSLVINKAKYFWLRQYMSALRLLLALRVSEYSLSSL